MTASKSQLRTEALARRRALSADQRNSFSLEIERRLFEHLKQSITEEHHLLAYRALSEEVDTTALFMTPPCHIYAPRMHGGRDMHWLGVTEKTNWISGAFGIPEPESGPDWNHEQGSAILLCPMVGFDRKGNRLGMGKGCFDRWLEQFQSRIDSVIGLAFSCQELPAIPAEAHDIPLQTIITEKEIISCPTT
ncbi:MAG: 5-formyltetrahydrofolate cyclo-ligase [Mariprofundaceae bacterium]|nr:5-formyltetrahydrofolate cyclo-ligase [Mariprofundaceae bacterium]